MRAETRARTPLVRTLDRERVWPPPIWLMRQAGRYLPEYRELRARAGSFLALCDDPELAAEITLQPIRRFDLDAAIVFSDILLVPRAMGRRVAFAEGHGPDLDPIDADSVLMLSTDGARDRLQPVIEACRIVRQRLPRTTSLIGFCGAPWTVATYMVGGTATPDQMPARLFMHREAGAFAALIDRLVEVSAAFLVAQLRAGADAVQIFDTWAGVLGAEEFRRWSIAPTAQIVAAVRKAVPGAKVIGFPRGAAMHLFAYVSETGVDAVGLDWTVPLSHARAVQERLPVQGNLDPAVLAVGGPVLERSIDAILDALGGGPLIFNLGHGVLPQTPPEHVAKLVARVRSRAERRP